MFRMCLDLATKDLLQKSTALAATVAPTSRQKDVLAERLKWLFANNVLHGDLEELSQCIKDDGNDAAHDGNIGKNEALDLLEFTEHLLEHIYTRPEKVRLANVRRQERRNPIP